MTKVKLFDSTRGLVVEVQMEFDIAGIALRQLIEDHMGLWQYKLHKYESGVFEIWEASKILGYVEVV